MQIDISKGYSQYSVDELLEYSYKGLLCCGKYELDGFLSYLLNDVEMRIKDAYEEASCAKDDGGYDEGYQDAIDDMRDKLREMSC